jgi:hypothetical protein
MGKEWSMDGYFDGGYELKLINKNGQYRAAFMVSVNGGGTYGVYDADSNGQRGAYSSVTVPLNRWTHVGATFDTNSPDRSPSDPSVGRVRIYINGHDVTTSDPNPNTSPYSEPGTGETSIFPYSQHSFPGDSAAPPSANYNPWAYRYQDSNGWHYTGWCGTPFTIGGVNWSNSGYNFIGMLDEVKLWNVTKDASYFHQVDAGTAPEIIDAVGTGNQIAVTFSEGVYTDAGHTSPLQPSDFTLTDVGNNNPRTITGVAHTAGSNVATLTLSASSVAADYGADTLKAATTSSIYDDCGVAMGTGTVTIRSSGVPGGASTFNFSESAGSSTISDDEHIVTGSVNDSAGTIRGDGYFTGDGASNYVTFTNNNDAFLADRTLTVETVIKPAGTFGDNMALRVFERTANGNWQISVWRKPGTSDIPNYNPPTGVGSIAFWLKPTDMYSNPDGYSNNYKVCLTDYTNYPIVSGHWYRVRAVWNSDKTTGIPCDIYVDDLGADGLGTGENWTGFKNATKADQSYVKVGGRLYTGDTIVKNAGAFYIGQNGAGGTYWNGLIDWIRIDPYSVDYSGIDP